DTQRGAVRMIRQEVERITALVNQWMFVARPRPPQTQRHDLRHILSAVAARLAPALDHAGVRLEIQIEDEEEIATVHVDALRMEQVLQNLIQNAIQAMPEGGRLQIDLVRESTSVTLHMLDQGTGFSAEALQRFGEPFFSEREGGMGIGLAMACEVIEAHSGMLSASNHPSGGGLVTCQLPLVVDALPSAALP
ncbi:MAG: ATP-binding protein, partial [Verrucomicrobiota bacterium]